MPKFDEDGSLKRLKTAIQKDDIDAVKDIIDKHEGIPATIGGSNSTYAYAEVMDVAFNKQPINITIIELLLRAPESLDELMTGGWYSTGKMISYIKVAIQSELPDDIILTIVNYPRLNDIIRTVGDTQSIAQLLELTNISAAVFLAINNLRAVQQFHDGKRRARHLESLAQAKDADSANLPALSTESLYEQISEIVKAIIHIRERNSMVDIQELNGKFAKLLGELHNRGALDKHRLMPIFADLLQRVLGRDISHYQQLRTTFDRFIDFKEYADTKENKILQGLVIYAKDSETYQGATNPQLQEIVFVLTLPRVLAEVVRSGEVVLHYALYNERIFKLLLTYQNFIAAAANNDNMVFKYACESKLYACIDDLLKIPGVRSSVKYIKNDTSHWLNAIITGCYSESPATASEDAFNKARELLIVTESKPSISLLIKALACSNVSLIHLCFELNPNLKGEIANLRADQVPSISLDSAPLVQLMLLVMRRQYEYNVDDASIAEILHMLFICGDAVRAAYLRVEKQFPDRTRQLASLPVNPLLLGAIPAAAPLAPAFAATRRSDSPPKSESNKSVSGLLSVLKPTVKGWF
jgi:hypothetical protein